MSDGDAYQPYRPETDDYIITDGDWDVNKRWADDVAKPDWPSLLSADPAVPAIRLSLFQANDEKPDFQWKPGFISCDDFQIHKYSQFLSKLFILDTSSGYCWTYDTLKLSTWSLVSWCFDKLSGLKIWQIVIYPSVLDTYNIKSPRWRKNSADNSFMDGIS